MRSWFKSESSGDLRYGCMAALLLALLAVAYTESYPQQPATSIAVNVELVNLNVAVIDKNGKPYSDLSLNNFRIYDNGVEQAIQHFSHDDLPYSMGLVLDRSGSMAGMIQDVYSAAFHTVRASKKDDEFFIELFNDRVELRQGLTTDPAVLQRQLEGVSAYGRTSLYDAIMTGLDELKKGRHEKKALLVVTDGADNSSRHSFQEVLERARAENAVIYVVGMFDEFMLALELTREDQLKTSLSQMAEVTGGHAYFPKSIKQCEQACITVAKDLREQYSLGYYPHPKLLDGNWRTVQVQLSLPEELYKDGLIARTRSGYFAPKQ